jgi:hypothetical protein
MAVVSGVVSLLRQGQQGLTSDAPHFLSVGAVFFC